MNKLDSYNTQFDTNVKKVIDMDITFDGNKLILFV